MLESPDERIQKRIQSFLIRLAAIWLLGGTPLVKEVVPREGFEPTTN